MSVDADLAEVVAAHGVELVQRGERWWALCPLHEEKTPSFTVRDGRWRCFGCGRGGDTVDFVMQMHGCSFLEALRILGADRPVETRADRERRQYRRGLVRAFREWEAQFSNELGAYIRLAYAVLRRVQTEADLEKVGGLYQRLLVLEHYSDLLVNGDTDARLNLFGAWRAQHGGV